MIDSLKKTYDNILKRSIVIYENYYEYIITIIICFLLLVISMMIATCSPFGINAVINQDGLIQIYPEFVAQVKEIKSGHVFPFYTLNIGSFKDTFNMTGMNYIISPWLLLVYRFLPESCYYVFYSINFFLYYLLSGFSIIYYMKHKHYHSISNKKQLIVIGISYAACSYSAVFFRYMAGFKYLPFIPLIILGLEQLVYKKKYSLYITILFLLMIYNPYQAFLACEFVFLYFFTIHFKDWLHFLKSGFRFALASIITACLCSLWLIPYFYMLTSSIYSTRDSFKPSLLKWFTNILNIFSEYRFMNIQESVSLNNAQCSLYGGFILLLAFPIFILNKNIDLKYKIKRILLLLLLFISFDNELLNYILHGFHYQSNVPNRFAAFFIFVLFSILGDINEYIINNKRILLASYIVILIFYLSVYILCDVPTVSIIISIVIMIMYMLIIISYYYSKKDKCALLYPIVLVEVIFNFVVLFSSTIGNSGNAYPKVVSSINTIAAEIPEMKDSMIKTEYLSNSGSYTNIGNISDISTLSFFASDNTDDSTNRAIFYNIAHSPNTIYYFNGNPLADMMLGIKYHIENCYDTETISLYNKIYSYDHYNVYENPYYVAPMFVVNDKISKITKEIDDDDYNNPIEYQNAISNAICEQDLFNIVPITEYNEGLSEDTVYYRYGNTYETEYQNNRVNMQEVNINIKSSGVYIAYGYVILYLGDSSESDEEELTISVPIEMDNTTDSPKNNDYKPSIGLINWETMEKMHDVLSESKAENWTSNGHRLTASICAKEKGTLYISLPYYEGWTAYIDGKKTETYRFMGSMGVDIEPGEHEIELVYLPKGVIPALIITISTLLLLVVYNTIKYIKTNKGNNNYNKTEEE